MMRLILVVLLAAAIFVAFTAAMGTIRAAQDLGQARERSNMPAPYQRLSYAALLLLMIGVTSGLLGGA